jgi:hypothetical protein
VVYKKFFEYALNKKSDESKSKELFAELFAAVIRNPELLMEKLPNGTKYIQEIILANRGDVVGRVSGEPSATRTGQQEVGETVEKAKPTFENLAKNVDGISRFDRAFTIDTEASRLMQMERPVSGVIELLGSLADPKTSKETTKELDLDYPMDADRTKTLSNVIQNQVTKLVGIVNGRAGDTSNKIRLRVGDHPTKKNKEGGPQGIYKTMSILEAAKMMAEGPVNFDYSGLLEGFMINLVDVETGKYDQRLVESAALAALHWVMNTQPMGKLDREQIAKQFKIEETEITANHIRLANSGFGRRILQTPEVVTQVLAALKRDGLGASEADAIAALHEFNALWSQLFPPEQARIIQLLVRRVTVTTAGLAVDIRREGIAGVIREMVAPRRMEAAE